VSPLSYVQTAWLSAMNISTIVCLSLVSITCTILLFLAVRHQMRKPHRHSFAGSVDESRFRKRIQQVRTQTILYVTSHTNNCLWLVLFNRLVVNSLDSNDVNSNDPVIFAVGVMLFLFIPLDGFNIYCIYVFPRYTRIRKRFPDQSRLWCLRLLYRKDEGESEIISRQRSNMFQQGESTGFPTIFSGSNVTSSNEPLQTTDQVCGPNVECSPALIGVNNELGNTTADSCKTFIDECMLDLETDQNDITLYIDE
jgi:hypothetical protein